MYYRRVFRIFTQITKGLTPLPESCLPSQNLFATSQEPLPFPRHQGGICHLLNCLMFQPLFIEHKLLASTRILPLLPIDLPHVLRDPLGSRGALSQVPQVAHPRSRGGPSCLLVANLQPHCGNRQAIQGLRRVMYNHETLSDKYWTELVTC